MNVFEFRERLIADYQRFARSFTQIKAGDIRQYVDAEYAKGRFWPAPMVQLSPNFESGGKVDDLVGRGLLDEECARIFRVKTPGNPFGTPMTLHKHQTDAIMVAKRHESYVLTTGTGSGKSLAYFVPIIDDVLRRRRAGEPRRGITAIVVYPMNALCNSQREELDKFLSLGYGAGGGPVTFARYTGQENTAERERIAKDPPDILLTNYVMLELIMTRFVDSDPAVRQHAAGLRFFVLDELHTYRGRQGADVAMLVRRVRERFNPNLLCIGTSATMVSEGNLHSRHQAVADVASRLFGTPVKAENVITETLVPVTTPGAPVSATDLSAAILAGVPSDPTFEQLRTHPIAAWVEQNLGLENRNGRLVRISRPLTVAQAAAKLAADAGLPQERCAKYLSDFLLMAFAVTDDQGRGFFAFRLHQFISGAGSVYATLEPEGRRYLTMDGQQYQPGDRDKLLYNLAFCRECGQEYFPVWAAADGGSAAKFTPRELNERSHQNEDATYGYLAPDPHRRVDLEALLPDDWMEIVRGEPRLKRYYRKSVPQAINVSPLGEPSSDGLPLWFIPGNFRFCLNCGVYYDGSVRSDFSKLTGLSVEGRSSATTVLTLSALKYLMSTDLDDQAKKLLGFTDNRQDASLQAGHFNDFIQVLLLRGALLAAIKSEPGRRLESDVLTQRVTDHLNLEPFDYASNPDTRGVKAHRTRGTLRDVLGYRLFYDLRRGWRITNPNLEQLNLLNIRYAGLEDWCRDEGEWQHLHPFLAAISARQRYEIAVQLLHQMRRDLCVKTIYLDPSFQEQIRNRSYDELREPWGLSEGEPLFAGAVLVPRAQSGSPDRRFVHLSYRSRFGRQFKAQMKRVADSKNWFGHFDEETYNAVVDSLLASLGSGGYIEKCVVEGGHEGYRLDSSMLEWCLPDESGSDQGGAAGGTNRFFYQLYQNVADLLSEDGRFLHQLEAREHTAQVDPEQREIREARFRRGIEPLQPNAGMELSSGLPVLFCSPTMELGVDISTLNTVYMRNMPPTPANYTQRSGRAGRSGQPALVITYCAAKSPHDQYFFADPARMVAGIVNPPTIDLANEDLIRSHLHSVWLAETEARLGSSVRDVLDLEHPDLAINLDITGQCQRPAVQSEADGRARRILAMLGLDLTPAAAPWYTPTWLDNTVKGAFRRLNDAFRRWRSLYNATSTQLRLANAVLQNAASTEQERREAKSRHDEAYSQQNLLLEGRPSMNSDFYTYRYLASEGFLPGYNFPRLPLLAFIPGRRERVVRDSFLSRPRFLGLSEFGPQSIIYHEGSTYRVWRTTLTVRDETQVTAAARLPVQRARLCPQCGYGHFGDQRDFERCVSCNAQLAGSRPPLDNLYRIDQVSTRRVTRITSDEEERLRQGYEMITTFRYAEENQAPRFESLVFAHDGEQLLELRYGPSATIWRINLGWRRRLDKSIYGFSIDVNTGEWTKDSQTPTDAEDDNVREGKNIQRITPYVEDTKNILLVLPKIPLSLEALITLEYALKRGVETVFQLEEADLASEPLPLRSDPRTILFYESAEGGAGVLTRLARDPVALRKVAQAALTVCHYGAGLGPGDGPEAQIHPQVQLCDTHPECEAGCYRCLLSYYNQPDHAIIDRKNQDSIELLLRLTGAQVHENNIGGSGDTFSELLNASASTLERRWLQMLRRGGYRLPDRAQPYLAEFETRPDFAYSAEQVVVYIDGPSHLGGSAQLNDAAMSRRLQDAGLTVIRFSARESEWPGVLAAHHWVFGPGQGED